MVHQKKCSQVPAPVRCLFGKLRFVNGASWPDDPVFPLLRLLAVLTLEVG